MPTVFAILQVATTATATGATAVTAATAPPAQSLIGTPTVMQNNVEMDASQARLRYNYLVYQPYLGAGDAPGIASVSGVSDWIALPGISADYPQTQLAVDAAAEVSNQSVVFTLTANVTYTQTTPKMEKVLTE